MRWLISTSHHHHHHSRAHALFLAAVNPPNATAHTSFLQSLPEITANKNQRVKNIKRLHHKQQRAKQKQFLVEGHRLFLDAMQAGMKLDLLFLDQTAFTHPQGQMLAQELLNRRAQLHGKVFRVPRTVISECCDTETPQGIVASFQLDCPPLPPAPTFVLVLEGISDPGNMGTLLRSAAGAGADAALVIKGSTDVWGPKALRAGMGAQFRLPIFSMVDWDSAAEQLNSWGCAVHAADGVAESLYTDVSWKEPTALIIGAEAHGVSQAVKADVRTSCFRIPMAYGLESLNAAAAGSIALYEVYRQRKLGNRG